MILKFKYDEYDDIREEYENLFDYVDFESTEEQDGNSLVVDTDRIVFPQLHISIREAIWYTRNEEVEDSNDEEAWEEQDSVYVTYDENEKDINKYISFTTGTIYYAIADACKEVGYPLEKYEDLDCYIDTSEFIEEEEVKKLYPDNWKEDAMAKYPDFFDAIKNQTFKIIKFYSSTKIDVYGEESVLEVHLGDTYYYKFCEWHVYNSHKETDQDAAYQKVLNFTRKLVNNEIFVVICFVDGRRKGTEEYRMADITNITTQSVFKAFQDKYPELKEGSHKICLRWCFWEGKETYDDNFVS